MSLDREKKEAVLARQNYDKYLAAAEKLSKQLDSPEPSPEVETALAEAIDFLENNKQEVEREEPWKLLNRWCQTMIFLHIPNV